MPEDELEAWARDLRIGGYRPSVTVRRLIEERGVAEEAAIQLVQRVYETSHPINPREGATTIRLLISVGIIFAGFAMVAGPAMWPEVYQRAARVSSSGGFTYWVLALFLIGMGFKRLVFATANRSDRGAPGGDD